MPTDKASVPYRPDPNNQNLQQSLKLIEEAIKGEKEDQLFYEFLMSEAPTQDEKDIIASIRDDEVKHNKMFKQIYKQLTNKTMTSESAANFVRPATYLEGLKQALFGELKAVEKYRAIRTGLPTQKNRDMLFEIITDELKHAAKYNYLITLNQHSSPDKEMQQSTEAIPQKTDIVKTKQESNTMNTDTQQGNKNRTTESTDSNLGTISIAKGNPDTKSQTTENTDSLPDQWVQYFQPLVTSALKEAKEGMDLTHLFQKYILTGVLIGNQYTPNQAIEQVEKWGTTGESKLLQESKVMKI